MTTCIYYVTNIIPYVYISFCVLYTFHETACILEKNWLEYILSRLENIKILLNWVYTHLCWWQWFENFLSWGRPGHLSRELRLSTIFGGDGAWCSNSKSAYLLKSIELYKIARGAILNIYQYMIKWRSPHKYKV